MKLETIHNLATNTADAALLALASINNGTFLTLDTQPERIRSVDAEGRVVSAGLTWWELREAAGQWSDLIKLVAALPFAIILIGMSRGSDIGAQAHNAFMAFTMVVIGAFLVLGLFAWKDYGIIFHSDGRIEAPFGWLMKARLRRFGDLSQLHSVESNNGSVVLWSRDGYSLTLTGRRHSDQYAKSLAILINVALEEIKDARRAESYRRMGGDASMRRALA